MSFVGLMGLLIIKGDTSSNPMIAQTAPAIRLESFPRETSQTHVSDLKLINFWASWCTPCLAEHPVLMSMAGQGLEIVGIAYRDTPENIETFLTRHGDPFSRVYLDPEGDALIDYGVAGVPESFLIDKNGKILAHISGPIIQENFERDLRPFLADFSRRP